MVFYEHVADSSPLQLGWSVWLIMTHDCGVIFVFMCHFSHHWHGDHPQVHPTLTGLKQLNTDTISNLKWFLACWFTIAKSPPQNKHLSSWYAGNLHEILRLNLNIERWKACTWKVHISFLWFIGDVFFEILTVFNLQYPFCVPSYMCIHDPIDYVRLLLSI